VTTLENAVLRRLMRTSVNTLDLSQLANALRQIAEMLAQESVALQQQINALAAAVGGPDKT